VSQEPSSVKNSHYIARRLTKRWEFTQNSSSRQLYYYDFDEDRFGIHSSKNLYTFKDESAWPRAVESFFNDNLENHFNTYLDRFEVDRAYSPTPLQVRALRLTVFLQTVRTANDAELMEIYDKGAAYLDDLHEEAQDKYDFAHVTLPEGELCFPSVGIFAIGFSGAEFGLAVPITRTTFAMAMPKPMGPRVEEMKRLMAMGGAKVFAGLSVGLDTSSRVVLPPSFYGTHEANLRRWLFIMRDNCKRLVTLQKDLNRTLYGTDFVPRRPTDRQP
jgi:hypothetical protein